MMTNSLSLRRTCVPLITLVALVIGFSVADATPAHAEKPPVAFDQFNAPTCDGTTWHDRAVAQYNTVDEHGGDVPDLTLVFGQRLIDFNEGEVVVLYDAGGQNPWHVDDGTSLGVPPLCATRYAAGAPLSEWMFCTDRYSRACDGTNANGELTGYKGEPIAAPQPLSNNPRLTPQQEKLIAYLIRNGHSYSGDAGKTFYGATRASSGDGTNERYALQELVWCISDPVAASTTDAEEPIRADVCDLNIGPAEQTRILAMIPDTPTAQLAFGGPVGPREVGETAEFVLTTNLYSQPIELSLTRGAGTLTVSGGGAVLSGSELVVPGSDPSVTTTVYVQVSATSTGHIGLEAAVTPASRTHIKWSGAEAEAKRP